MEAVAIGANMDKILHISKFYYPYAGGTEQIARDIVCALKDQYEQKVIAFNEGNTDSVEIIDDIEITKCACCRIIASQPLSMTYSRQLQSLFDRFQPDIVLFHYPDPFVAHILLGILRRHTCKLVLYWHLDIVKQKIIRVFFYGQNRRLLRRSNRIIATSPGYIEGSIWLKSVKDKCVVIPNCINVDRMEITPDIEHRANEIRRENCDKTICVAVGRHTAYKGFTYLLQASRLLDDSFRIFLAGVGELTDSLHEEAKGDGKIQFVGKVSDPELKALILAADIFCFPSITKNEAFGLALAEGMYYGKPAVTFTIPGSGVNYVCIGGEDGIEVKNRDVVQYAEAMKRLAADSLLRERYGEAGRKRVEENFLSTRFYENVRNVIGEL